MTRVLLYWNHICVLHRQEKIFLNALSERLQAEGIVLEVRYFGLGYPESMSQYLLKPDAELPDLIVSADLEVFDNPDIFSKLQPELYSVEDWVKLRDIPMLKAVTRSSYLLPFVSIPLVYFTHQPEICAQTALLDWNGLAFGGINNSAAKTIVQSVWENWGRKAAKSFLENNMVYKMPIEAFHAVQQGKANTALVPSLYALRADNKETFMRIPKEGPVLIPSYLCARSSTPQWALERVAEEILSRELCDFYASNGDLIVFPACTELRSKQESDRALCPSPTWQNTISYSDFYQLYCEHIPSAINFSCAQ